MPIRDCGVVLAPIESW